MTYKRKPVKFGPLSIFASPNDEKSADSQIVELSASDESRVNFSNQASSLLRAMEGLDREKPEGKSPTPSVIQTFGKYELIWQLSSDAISTTYAARTEGITALLCLRIFNERMRGDAEVRQIQQAANRATELTHPNVIVVYENGIGEDGSPYVVTEWVEGVNLAEILKAEKRLSIARFLSIFSQICDGLGEAHSQQLVHGNLSPTKILFANNEEQTDLIKMKDFGMPPDPVQSAFYVSPEQCLDRARIDARADIYSLGCIMYEALVGSPPFVGHKKSQASLNYLHELANQYSPDAPEHTALKLLDCIIVKCLQTNRSKRFGSMRELKDGLRLVSDCICDGSKRRLPRKAEKLLLFRFLDFFDKKIVACMFAYLVLGLCSIKFVSELQVQKYIDAAQLAVMTGNWSLAQSNWKLAIQQAEWANKPVSLQADLHWELADTYQHQLDESTVSLGYQSENASGFITGRDNRKSGFNNALALDAIDEWKKALGYFKHGTHFKSYELSLWNEIGHMWLALDDREAREEERRAARHSAQAMFDSNKYAECAAFCSQYLIANDDTRVATLAAQANLKLADKTTATQALRYAGRAAYFSQCGERSDPDLTVYTTRMNLYPSTQSWLACTQRALEAGDLQAAYGMVSGFAPQISPLVPALANYHNLQKRAYGALPHKSEWVANGTASLENALALEEKLEGKHDNSLASTLSQLAGCYLASGQISPALETYKKLFDLPVLDKYAYDEQALIYANLLQQNHRSKDAIKFLENRLRSNDGTLDTNSRLYVGLIKAYADAKSTLEAHEAAVELCDGIELEPDKMRVETEIQGGRPESHGPSQKDSGSVGREPAGKRTGKWTSIHESHRNISPSKYTGRYTPPTKYTGPYPSDSGF
jgi:serine/threonine protein kinase